MFRKDTTRHDRGGEHDTTGFASLPRNTQKQLLRDALNMTATRMLVEHGIRETAHLYQGNAAAALEMTGTHAMLRQITHQLPPAQQAALPDALGIALTTQQAMHAQLQEHFRSVIAAQQGATAKSRWEEFDDGLALAARVLSFGLIRKR